MDYSPDSFEVDGGDAIGFTLPVLIGIAAVCCTRCGSLPRNLHDDSQALLPG